MKTLQFVGFASAIDLMLLSQACMVIANEPKQKKREVIKGGYTPLLLWSNGGIGKKWPRETPPRAPNCTKFSSDALAR